MSSYVMIGIPILILLLIIAYITLYNRLNRLRVKVEEAGAGVDVALEKRFDLLSEEIEAVKKYLSHEYQIMTDPLHIGKLARGDCLKGAPAGEPRFHIREPVGDRLDNPGV